MGQSEETRVVVDRLLRAIAAGEPTQIAGVYAEHVSWQLAWPEDDMTAPYRGFVIDRLVPTSKTITAPSPNLRCPKSRTPR